MSEHTPGPWDYSDQKGSPGHCFVAQVWNSEGESLAVIDATIDPAVATANARLMAAAPELLEVTQGLLSLCERYLGPMLAGGEMTKAREAIAKAISRPNDGREGQ